MRDDGKFIRLFWALLLSVIGFVALLVLLFLLVRLFFGVLSYMPWMQYVFVLTILSVPAVLFISAFIIYFKRTTSHPSQAARIISYITISAFLLAWGLFYIADLVYFFRNGTSKIADYHTWNMVFLASNVAVIFILGVIQALSMPKEADWMEKHRVG